MAAGKFVYKICVVSAACILLSAGCFLYGMKTQPALPLPTVSQLQLGDWVFRGGTGSDSALIKRLSASAYSHVGMVVQLQPQVLIAHATTDDDPQHPDQVLLTPLETFLSPQFADTVAVARPRFLSTQQRVQAAFYARQQVGRRFVLRTREEQPFYCTLLLTDAVAAQGVSIPVKWQYLDVAVFRGEYLFPQGLLHTDLEWVYRAQVEQR